MSSKDSKTDTGAALKSKAAGKQEASTKKGEPIESKAKAAPDLSKGEDRERQSEAPAGYSRGEGQKPVSKAYKDNWNAIYGKRKK